MSDPLDGSPSSLILPITDKGAETDEIKDKSEEDILNKTHDTGSKYIPSANVDTLCVDSLKKCGDCQNGAINCKQQIELEHELHIEQPYKSSCNSYG